MPPPFVPSCCGSLGGQADGDPEARLRAQLSQTEGRHSRPEASAKRPRVSPAHWGPRTGAGDACVGLPCCVRRQPRRPPSAFAQTHVCFYFGNYTERGCLELVQFGGRRSDLQ